MTAYHPKICRICDTRSADGVQISRSGFCPWHGAAVLAISVELPGAVTRGDHKTVARLLAPFGLRVTPGGGVGGAGSKSRSRTPKVPVT